MRADFYRTLQELLRRGESPRLESDLEYLGRERLYWSGGVLGAEISRNAFTQTLTAPTGLVICGAGHVARALAVAARTVGFTVTVLDDRRELMSYDYFPAGVDLRCGSFAELLEADFGPAPFFAVMTRGHAEDWTCLEAILNRDYGYVGLMGSRGKVAATRNRLAELGFDRETIARLHTPIGLDIGAETPAEIAISVVAELIQCRKALGAEAPLGNDLIDGLDHFPYAMVTLVECRGSTPRGEGARMIVGPDGSIRGTIGGGIAEATAIGQALEALETNQCAIHTYRMDGSAESICGGVVKYMIIPVREDDFTC